MVMKRTMNLPQAPSRRLGIAEAKARLSAVLRDGAPGATVIHNRGRDVAVLLPIAEYQTLRARAERDVRGGAGFLARLEVLKARLGGSAAASA